MDYCSCNQLICIYTLPRSAHHLPAWVLRVPGGEEVVGAVRQAALARHCRHLSQGAGGWGSWERESDGEGDQEDSHPLLPAGLHPLHQEAVLQAEEEVSRYV